jgi:hypothetical protein
MEKGRRRKNNIVITGWRGEGKSKKKEKAADQRGQKILFKKT